MLLYATPDDLAAWTGAPAPADADRLLRSASGLVREATLCDIYKTDPDGYPLVASVRQAFTDATCAQASFWSDLGIKPWLGPAGVRPVAQSKGLGSASLSYSLPAETTAAQVNAWRELCPDAARLLRAEGLMHTTAWTYG